MTFGITDKINPGSSSGQILIWNNSTKQYANALPTGNNGISITSGDGSLQIGNSNEYPLTYIDGDLFPGSADASISNGTVYNLLNFSYSITKNNNLLIGTQFSNSVFEFQQTGLYGVLITVSYAPSVSTGTYESYISAINSSGNPTGRRFCYDCRNWPAATAFPANMHFMGSIEVTSTSTYYAPFIFQQTGVSQIVGYSSEGGNTNPQTSSFTVWQIA